MEVYILQVKKNHKVVVKIFCRPGLMLVALESVPTEEDQDQARDQGSPLCWQGRWLVFRPEGNTFLPP